MSDVSPKSLPDQTEPLTLALFAAALVLLAVFLTVQSRTGQLMMPLRLFADRNRSGSYATMMFIGAGMFGTFYSLSLYLQQIHGYTTAFLAASALFATGFAVVMTTVRTPRQEQPSPGAETRPA